MLSKGTSRKKVLDMFSAEINREKAKINKKPGNRKTADSDSDSSASVHVLNTDEVSGVAGVVTWGSNSVRNIAPGEQETWGGPGQNVWPRAAKRKPAWGQIAMQQNLEQHLKAKKKKAEMMHMEVEDEIDTMDATIEPEAEDKVKEVIERVKRLGRPKEDESD